MTAGGNAADAIVAVAAALGVLYPHMTGIGGDAFFLYFDARSGELFAYNGSGAAANLADLHFYANRNLSRVPERGGAAASTVPGAVDAWFALHERFGTQPMDRILAPAIAYARDGAPAARSFVSALHRLRETLALDEGAASLYLDHGPQRVGDPFVNPRLSATLEAIAGGGRAWFYEGEGAERIERCCRRVDSPLRGDDLAAHHGFFTPPAHGSFYGSGSATVPPNSQGIAAIIAEQTYERCMRQWSSGGEAVSHAARAHAGIESIRLAFADRDASVGDPREIGPWESLLSAQHADELARAIDPNAARASEVATAGGGDTSYFACVDGHGNAVSYIQSLFLGFGASVVVPELGIPLQNRGIAFELSSGGLRSLAPRKLPFHTLMPCMMLRDGRPWLVHGSMGGEGQPQTALQLVSAIVCDGADPQVAIEAPRWRWGADADSERPAVHVERRIGPACVEGLRARGHEVRLTEDWDELMGHAGAIVIEGTKGVLTGGADPRSDGAALGC